MQKACFGRVQLSLEGSRCNFLQISHKEYQCLPFAIEEFINESGTSRETKTLISLQRTVDQMVGY